MPIEKLTIQNFRNLSEVQLTPGPQLNLFYGENGSGKTSLLESLYFLSTGRSFRTRYVPNLIQNGAERFLVAAEYDHQPIGIERFKNGQYHIRLDKEAVTISRLAKLLPIQFLNHDIYMLVAGGPEYKRQFIDWGVFHVEHAENFLPLWRQYKSALKQRNAALKKKTMDRNQIALWNTHLVKTAEPITQWRQTYTQHFIPILDAVLKKLLDLKDISFRFLPGWDTHYSLDEVLRQNIEKDLGLRYTEYGPHRADLKILIHDMTLENALSRGQQKLFACGMRLAQAIEYQEKMHKPCIFLLDDLSAELDNTSLSKVCDLLISLNTQVFFTSTQQHLFNDFFKSDSAKKFHVEHGQIKEIV